MEKSVVLQQENSSQLSGEEFMKAWLALKKCKH